MATDDPLARLCPQMPVDKARNAEQAAIVGEASSQALLAGSQPEVTLPWLPRSRVAYPSGTKRDPKSFNQVLLSTETWHQADCVEISQGAYRLLPPPHHSRLCTESTQGVAHMDQLLRLEAQDSSDKSLSSNKRVSQRTGRTADSAPGKIDDDMARLQQMKPYLTWVYLETMLPKLESHSMEKSATQHFHQDFERTTPFEPSDSAVGVTLSGEKAELETELMRVVFNILDNPDLLRSSFLEKPPNQEDWHSYRTMEIKKMCTTFLVLYDNEEHPPAILPSLWRSLAEAYHASAVPQHQRGQTYTAHEAAHLVNVGLGALLARVFAGDASVEPNAWGTFTTLRSWGRFLPTELTKDIQVRRQIVAYVAIFEDALAVRLMRRILRAFASHSYRAFRRQSAPWARPPAGPFVNRVLRFLASDAERSRAYGRMVLEWARTVFQKAWDGEAEFSWASDAGCAIEFMRVLYQERERLQLDPADFAMPFLFKRLDFLEVPVRWLQRTAPPPAANRAHVLDHPWLFPAAGLVTFFRAASYAAMFDAFARAIALSTMSMRLSMLAEPALLERLAPAQTSYLVLEIRRARILEDALNRLWRRRARELRRPLKVRMGIDEGEEGVDLGGVQQEFFRLALGQALDPAYGLFAVDEVTRMAWFVPAAAAPLYQFVLVGLLVGLAVYNGITLPLTFPLALYRKLLGWPVEALEDIEDGWPVLAKGLRSMEEWDDGDVADVFVRSYVFSGESNGQPFEIDMYKHKREDPWPAASTPTMPSGSPHAGSTVGPSSHSGSDAAIDTPRTSHSDGSPLRGHPSPGAEADGYEAPLVTNETRHAYIADYIFHLTDKTVRAQYDAFATGFHLPLDRAALRLFTPTALRDLVEGFQTLDVDALERVARYENGFGATHPLIADFWRVVRGFSPAELRSLLEFVTASDRVPVKGVEEMLFLVQRNGSDDARLPTSMTCFGRLLLPEYSSRAVLEARLRAAIENSRGFGVA